MTLTSEVFKTEILKTGLGLRAPYIQDLLKTKPKNIHWLELLADQYYQVPEFVLQPLDLLRESYSCVLHSVNLSLASVSSIPNKYLKFLENLMSRYEPAWFSDHLCFSRVGKIYTHDLLPIIFSQKNLDHIARRIDQLQIRFKKIFLIENISSYIFYFNSDSNFNYFLEADFLNQLVKKTGCGLLLDLNNLIVSSENHEKFGVVNHFLDQIDFKAVKQIHLAGAEQHEGIWIDTHSRKIADTTWDYFKKIQEAHGPIPTCLEWDNDLPGFNQILEETEKIEIIISNKTACSALKKEEKVDVENFKISEIKDELIDFDLESAWLGALTGQPEDLYQMMSAQQPEKYLKIYQNSIAGTLKKILRKTFKPLIKILGEELFEDCLDSYTKINFSHDFNLNSYGKDFSKIFKIK